MVFLFGLCLGCNIEPKPIRYGHDACHYCSMTIVDRHFASQLVTDKGKVYNYDATECMLYDIQDRNHDSIGLLLVTDYTNPETLIEAQNATFLISEDYPSPMGANLSAFSDPATIETLRLTSTASRYHWVDLQSLFDDNPGH